MPLHYAAAACSGQSRVHHLLAQKIMAPTLKPRLHGPPVCSPEVITGIMVPLLARSRSRKVQKQATSSTQCEATSEGPHGEVERWRGGRQDGSKFERFWSSGHDFISDLTHVQYSYTHSIKPITNCLSHSFVYELSLTKLYPYIYIYLPR